MDEFEESYYSLVNNLYLSFKALQVPNSETLLFLDFKEALNEEDAFKLVVTDLINNILANIVDRKST
jgi:hypothetical protein